MPNDRIKIDHKGEAAAREWNASMEKVARRAIPSTKGLSEAEVRSYLNRLQDLWPCGPEPEDPDRELLIAGMRALRDAATCLLEEAGFDRIVSAIAYREGFEAAELRNEVVARVWPMLLTIHHVAEYTRKVAQNVAWRWGAANSRYTQELPGMTFEESVRLQGGRSEELEDHASRPDVEHDLAELNAAVKRYGQSLQGQKRTKFYEFVDENGEVEEQGPLSAARRKQRERERRKLGKSLEEGGFVLPLKKKRS